MLTTLLAYVGANIGLADGLAEVKQRAVTCTTRDQIAHEGLSVWAKWSLHRNHVTMPLEIPSHGEWQKGRCALSNYKSEQSCHPDTKNRREGPVLETQTCGFCPHEGRDKCV